MLVMIDMKFQAFPGMLFFFSVHPEAMGDVFEKSKHNKPGEKKQSMKQDPVPAFKLNDELRHRDQ